jgi:hypothetical protein
VAEAERGEVDGDIVIGDGVPSTPEVVVVDTAVIDLEAGGDTDDVESMVYV